MSGEHLRFVGEFRDMDVLDDYVFPKGQELLKKEPDGRVTLSADAKSGPNTHPIGASLAVGGGEIRGAGPLGRLKPEDFGDLLGGID